MKTKKVLSMLTFLFLGFTAYAQPTLTGNAFADFETFPDVIKTADLPNDLATGGAAICTNAAFALGLDFINLYVHYNQIADRLTIGLDMQGVAGDSDGDGDPSTTSFCNAGYDLNNLDMGETVGISIDTNNDGTYDLYLGWAKTPATTTFGVYGISGGPCNTGLGMASSCLSLLSVPGVSTAAFADPPTFPAPDPEFSITGFSLLTNPAIQMDFYAWSDHPIGGEDNAQILNQALPVQLLSFKAHEKDNDVVLNWETATEINNQGFYPQVSFDGVEFTDLSFVEGQGNSSISNTYSYDYRPNTYHQTLYFRLKQMDIDGKESLSDLVTLNRRSTTQGFEIYPTLVKNQVTVVTGRIERVTYIELFDILGHSIKKEQLLAIAKQVLAVQSLTKGIYILKIYSENEILQVTKIMN